MPLVTLVLASDNANKIREVRQILGDYFEIVAQREAGFSGDVVEEGTTFKENALIKAQAVSDALRMPALADDSGLAVDMLGGGPGVLSARYAGVHGRDDLNNEKLLRELQDIPAQDRGARFVCALALVRPGQQPLIVEAAWEGCIAFTPKGKNGFGYDPLFELPDGRTSAELPAQEKNGSSHRGQALRMLRQSLEAESR